MEKAGIGITKCAIQKESVDKRSLSVSKEEYMEQKVIRVSTMVIVGALLLRLLSAAGPTITVSPELASFLFFLQTGRLIRPSSISFSPPPEETIPTSEQPTYPLIPSPTEPALLTFSPEAAEALSINCSFDYTADLSALLTQPLSWDLTGEAPTVLILHSHATESYTGTYPETTAYHTTDTEENLISIGSHLANLLEEGGIRVLHDTTLHDTPSYNDAYINSRASAQDYLAQYPSIRLILDLHRDSYEDEDGNQIVRTVFSQGTQLAQLMFVVGTDYAGYEHPDWQKNLALALKLQTQLEGLCPGICRSINLRSQRFNQDLSPGSLLIEVGACGNSRQEALLAAEVLAEGILSLAHGSK